MIWKELHASEPQVRAKSTDQSRFSAPLLSHAVLKGPDREGSLPSAGSFRFKHSCLFVASV